MLSSTPMARALLLCTAVVSLCSCSSSKPGTETAAKTPTIAPIEPITLYENELLSHQVAATGSGELRFELAPGGDAALFAIDPSSGALASQAAFNFEQPQDGDGDGVYSLTVVVVDEQGQRVERDVAVRVVDVLEHKAQVTFPLPNANLGGLASTSTVSGNLNLMNGEPVTADHGVSVLVNGAPATFDAADPSRWHAQVPVKTGENAISIAVGEAGANESIIVKNNLISTNLAQFDFDAAGEFAYGVATGVNAVVKANVADITAEPLFIFPFTFEGEQRCQRARGLVLDESAERVVFVCDDGPQHLDDDQRSVMAFDLTNGSFAELVPPAADWQDMEFVDSNTLVLYGDFNTLKWLQLDTGTTEIYALHEYDETSGLTGFSIGPNRIKSDRGKLYVFDFADVYRFDRDNLNISGYSPPDRSDVLLQPLALALDYESAMTATTAGGTLYYSPVVGTINTASFYAGDDELAGETSTPMHSVDGASPRGRLRLNYQEDAQALYAFDPATRTSYRVLDGSALQPLLPTSAAETAASLPTISSLSLNPSADALMAYSRSASQLDRVELDTGALKVMRQYVDRESRFGVSTFFAYRWADDVAFFAPVVDWGGTTAADDVHMFSIATADGAVVDHIVGAQLPGYLGLTLGSDSVRSGDIIVDEVSGRLLLTAWGQETVGTTCYEAIYWFDPATQLSEQVRVEAFPSGGTDAPYLSPINQSTREVITARWATGEVALLDLDTQGVTPVYLGPTPFSATSSPVLDTRRHRIIARSFESGDAGDWVRTGANVAASYDIATGKASILFPSDPAALNLSPQDIVIDNKNDRAFMISEQGLLLVVDLETGARAAVAP